MEEEFLDSEVLFITEKNLHKRIKLALYILLENKKINPQENKIKKEDLNCTMVNILDPSLKTTQVSSMVYL